MDKLIKLEQIKHKQRVENMKSKVDNKAPKVHSNNILRLNKLREDAIEYMQLMKRNMQLLVNINATMRTMGKIDSFRSGILVPNNLGPRIRALAHIEKENLRMGMRLMGMTGTLKLKQNNPERLKADIERHSRIPFSEDLLQKYNDQLKIPTDMALCWRYFRPVIFFDLEIQNVRPLGRVFIQLYTEAAPQVVLQFVQMALLNDTQSFQFTRIFPTLWLEAKFKVTDTNITSGLLEYDMRALSNDLDGGIFSFQLNEKRSDYLFIAISFKPLTVVDGRRFAFARNKKGFHIIQCLQDLGTRN